MRILQRSSRIFSQLLFRRKIVVLGQEYRDDHMTNLTERIIKNVDLKKHQIERHPVEIIKQQIYDFFDKEYSGASFSKVEDLSPIVTVAQNFDSVLIPEDHVSRAKKDNYYINADYMLRAHTSAHQVDLMKHGEKAFLCVGDVYRRDTIDKTHYPIFHQMEGLRLFDYDDLVR